MNSGGPTSADKAREWLTKLLIATLLLSAIGWSQGFELATLQTKFKGYTTQLRQHLSAPKPSSKPTSRVAQQRTPDVYDDAFLNGLSLAMSTQNYTVHELQFGITYDRRVVVSPIRLAQAYSIKHVSPTLSYEAISSLDTQYNRSSSLPQWHISRQNGAEIDRYNPSPRELDIKSLLFGQVLMGDYPAEIREKIIRKVTELHPYTYELSAVYQETLDGQGVDVYPVKANIDAVVALNRYAGGLIGVPAPKWEYIIKDKPLERYYYFTQSDHRLVKITEVYGRWHSFEQAQENSSVRILTYSQFNTTDTTMPTIEP
jgi:hypothetical protein